MPVKWQFTVAFSRYPGGGLLIVHQGVNCFAATWLLKDIMRFKLWPFLVASLNSKTTVQCNAALFEVFRLLLLLLVTEHLQGKTNDFLPVLNHACARLGVQAILTLHCSNERWIIAVVALNTHPYQRRPVANSNSFLWYLRGDECQWKWIVSCQNMMCRLFEKAMLHPKMVSRTNWNVWKALQQFLDLCQQNYWTMNFWQHRGAGVMKPPYSSHSINLSHTLVRVLVQSSRSILGVN